MKNSTPISTTKLRLARWAMAASVLATSVLLSACGGGGDSASFYVTAVVGGQNMGNYGPGTSPTLYVRAGQSFELDAAEPVLWTLYIGNTAITTIGSTVFYAGAEVTLTAETASRIAVDTYAAAPLFSPVAMTLVATSTFDSAQVATVDVLITN